MKPEQINGMKSKEKIVVLTAYTYPIARVLENAGIDMILVGDSGVMVELGKDSTKDATLSEMKMFTEAVNRGAKNTLVVVDMPIGTYDSPEDALKNAKELGGIVKVEGKPEIVKSLVENGIQVMGHIGYLPQTMELGKQSDSNLLEEAKEIEKAGAFCMVLECVEEKLAKKISEELDIPTIGIGSGEDCDGQVLVTNDLLGMYDKFVPSFVKKEMEFLVDAKDAVCRFITSVRK